VQREAQNADCCAASRCIHPPMPPPSSLLPPEPRREPGLAAPPRRSALPHASEGPRRAAARGAADRLRHGGAMAAGRALQRAGLRRDGARAARMAGGTTVRLLGPRWHALLLPPPLRPWRAEILDRRLASPSSPTSYSSMTVVLLQQASHRGGTTPASAAALGTAKLPAATCAPSPPVRPGLDGTGVPGHPMCIPCSLSLPPHRRPYSSQQVFMDANLDSQQVCMGMKTSISFLEVAHMWCVRFWLPVQIRCSLILFCCVDMSMPSYICS
jgi:hypothetical protein